MSPNSSLISALTNERLSFHEQIGAFLVLELATTFHSVIIGLNFSVTGLDDATLYPVLIFYRLFEGLEIGARLSATLFLSGKKCML